MDPQVLQTIAQVLGTALAFAIVKVFERKKDRRVQNAAETAATQATEAARQSATAAAQTAKNGVAVNSLAGQQSTLNDRSQEHSDAIMMMAEELGKSKQTIDWMARRNDDTLAALFRATAEMQSQQQLQERVDRLEEFAREAEHLRKAGRHMNGSVETIEIDEEY